MAAGMGVKLTMVPYKGGVEQLQDALAGHVDMMFEGNIFPHIKAGKLIGLAVSKNLIRWLTVTFRADPAGAIQREIDKLKAARRIAREAAAAAALGFRPRFFPGGGAFFADAEEEADAAPPAPPAGFFPFFPLRKPAAGSSSCVNSSSRSFLRCANLRQRNNQRSAFFLSCLESVVKASLRERSGGTAGCHHEEEERPTDRRVV
jgi:hypothetical protein